MDDDLFPPIAPIQAAMLDSRPPPPMTRYPCFVCGQPGLNLFMTAQPLGPPLTLCHTCRADIPGCLTSLEMRIIEQEEQLAAVGLVFDAAHDKAGAVDQQRYDRIRDELFRCIDQPARLPKVNAAIDAARARGDGLSAILAAEAACHVVANEAGAILADINELFYTIHRLPEAIGWHIPAEATRRRIAMGQPYARKETQ